MVAERAGILNWMIEGLAEARALGGLHPPPEALGLGAALVSDANPVGEFLEHCIIAAPGAQGIACGIFYRAFKLWVEENSARLWSGPAVKRTMAQRGVRISPTNGKDFYRDLGWADNESADALRSRAEAVGSPV